MMRVDRRGFVRLGAAGLAGAVALRRRLLAFAQAPSAGPSFELVQPELFAVTGGQPNCWADYDGDGDLDLFVGFKDAVANRLYRNDRGKFVEVAGEAGLADLTDTRAAAWGDSNDDGRLELFVANQDGTLNDLFRNDGSKFVDVAHELGMDADGRPATFGSNGPSVVDYDNDGRFDLFVAGYGRNFLFHNEGRGRFKEVADAMGVAGGDKATPSSW